MRNIVVCEDGQREAEKIQKILQENKGFFDDNAEIFLYTTGKKLIEDCKSGKLMPDLIFMDIKLPDMTGIEVSKTINQLAPYCYIVYVTSHIDYVTDVYSTEHQYYVLKNELKQRFPQIKEKILKMEQEHNEIVIIPIKNKQQKVLHKEDIRYIERKGRTTYIYMVDEQIETTLRLDELESFLGRNFVRCHNSFIISMRHMDSYKRECFTMDRGEKISISRKYQPYAKQCFVQLSKSFGGGRK